MGGWSQSENNATLWLHLASWNLPDSQLSWDSGKFQLVRWSHEVVLKSLDPPPTQPPTQPSTELGNLNSNELHFQCCAVSPPWLLAMNCTFNVVRCPHPEQSRKSGSFYVVRCPHPIDKVCAVSPPQQSMCGVPTLQINVFPRTHLLPPQKKYVRCPPPNLVLCLEHFGSVLDFEQNWECGWVCLKIFWRVSWECLVGVSRVSRKCLIGVW